MKETSWFFLSFMFKNVHLKWHLPFAPVPFSFVNFYYFLEEILSLLSYLPSTHNCIPVIPLLVLYRIFINCGMKLFYFENPNFHLYYIL